MGFDRRAFLKVLGGASAGIMVTPVPWKLLDDISIWTQNWSWIPRNIPGQTSFVHTVSKLCPGGTPLRVRLAENRAVRTMPVENHPLGGGLTPIAAAEVQLLHSPARVRMPLERTADGTYVETDWETVRKTLVEKLKQAGNKTAFISGDENGSTTEIMSAFAAKLGSDNMFIMPSEAQTAAQALHAMGIEGRLGYDIENSDCILAIGANILESFGTVTANRKAFFKKGERAKLVVASPMKTNTAAVADTWLAIKPGSEGVLALGIAAELIRRNRRTPADDFPEFARLSAGLTIEETANRTGLTPEAITAVADDLLAAQKPLVITGSTGAGGIGTAPIIAGFAANALLNNINRPGGLQVLEEAKPVLAGAKAREALWDKDLVSWLQEQDDTQMLVLHEANPVFALPNPSATKAALEKIPFKVALTCFRDETAEMCDYILPIPMGLERYDDLLNPYGYPKNIYCAGSPAQFHSKEILPTYAVLMVLAHDMGMPLSSMDFREVVDKHARRFGTNQHNLIAGNQAATNSAKSSIYSFKLRPALLEKTLMTEQASGLQLAIDRRLALGTPSTGIPPFNTKLLRETELLGSDMFVRVNSATARELGLAEGTKVTLSADSGAKIAARVHISEGVANKTVAATLGFGHTAFDEFSQNKGANVMELLSATPEPETNIATWAQTVVTVTKA